MGVSMSKVGLRKPRVVLLVPGLEFEEPQVSERALIESEKAPGEPERVTDGPQTAPDGP